MGTFTISKGMHAGSGQAFALLWLNEALNTFEGEKFVSYADDVRSLLARITTQWE